jgi:hypothetical protein
MEQKTRDHIEVAQGNWQFAVWISHPAPDRPDQSNAWAVVAAFYGAVHFVNAYLWEVHHTEPGNHHQRAASSTAIRCLCPFEVTTADLLHLAGLRATIRLLAFLSLMCTRPLRTWIKFWKSSLLKLEKRDGRNLHPARFTGAETSV